MVSRSWGNVKDAGAGGLDAEARTGRREDGDTICGNGYKPPNGSAGA